MPRSLKLSRHHSSIRWSSIPHGFPSLPAHGPHLILVCSFAPPKVFVAPKTSQPSNVTPSPSNPLGLFNSFTRAGPHILISFNSRRIAGISFKIITLKPRHTRPPNASQAVPAAFILARLAISALTPFMISPFVFILLLRSPPVKVQPPQLHKKTDVRVVALGRDLFPDHFPRRPPDTCGLPCPAGPTRSRPSGPPTPSLSRQPAPWASAAPDLLP